MNRNDRNAIVLFIALFLIGFLVFKLLSGPPHPSPAQTTTTTSAAPEQASVAPSTVPAATPVHVSSSAAKPPVQPLKKPASGPAMPPAETLHKELIPKNIEMVRCYYSQEIAPPGTTLSFDVNGSGFTSEFEKMISIEPAPYSDGRKPKVTVKNLRLVTANQIHGDLAVSPDAETQFVVLRVLIKGLPVFRAPEPFAVVRKGEVLTVIFVSMEENGRGGRFRVITNLDQDLAGKFKIAPSTPGIEVSNLELRLPHAIDGDLRIRPGVPPGDYGLVMSIADKDVFRRDNLIHIVKPNVGQSGFIQGAMAEERFHRPGDRVQLYVQGTGLTPADVTALTGQISEFDMGAGSFTYLSPTQMRLNFNAPANAPLGDYSVVITGANKEKLFERKQAFKLVGANWVAGVQVSPPARPGEKSQLKIIGRDLSPELAQQLRIETDEPGLTINNIRQADASSLLADLVVDSKVAPGDYWLHLSQNGKKIDPPFGSLIKVERP